MEGEGQQKGWGCRIIGPVGGGGEGGGGGARGGGEGQQKGGKSLGKGGPGGGCWKGRGRGLENKTRTHGRTPAHDGTTWIRRLWGAVGPRAGVVCATTSQGGKLKLELVASLFPLQGEGGRSFFLPFLSRGIVASLALFPPGKQNIPTPTRESTPFNVWCLGSSYLVVVVWCVSCLWHSSYHPFFCGLLVEIGACALGTSARPGSPHVRFDMLKHHPFGIAAFVSPSHPVTSIWGKKTLSLPFSLSPRQLFYPEPTCARSTYSHTFWVQLSRSQTVMNILGVNFSLPFVDPATLNLHVTLFVYWISPLYYFPHFPSLMFDEGRRLLRQLTPARQNLGLFVVLGLSQALVRISRCHWALQSAIKYHAIDHLYSEMHFNTRTGPPRPQARQPAPPC